MCNGIIVSCLPRLAGVHLKRGVISDLIIRFSGDIFPAVCYIGLCACKWSAEAEITKFPSAGVYFNLVFMEILL